ncbi:glycosyltransferase domain-containing protein [Rhodococcoides kroppenstedtii]|uniref:glycosyltransferase domain-containing protein n=1 Tax=Rhodococcoides kroppenstedtii TaxID=293050 RepID=UPI001BDE6696|nr:glycosyltransferase domain-containing protein [Rhodococcus kroppenstedtii]MBT1191095.1 DUF616 domain-containing protein [Rhodococcus kroppenstedtii]
MVYTALIGSYERPSEQPIALESSTKFICFTDDETLQSEYWNIILVKPRYPSDPIRSARYLKIHSNVVLPEYDQTLWIDNRVILLVDPTALFETVLGENLLVLPGHSFRETVKDEFDAVLDQRLDDPRRVRRQFDDYIANSPEVLNEPVLWTAILFRRKCEQVARFESCWHEQVLLHSRRDQLSVGYAITTEGITHSTLQIDNHASNMHTWVDAKLAGRVENGGRWNASTYRAGSMLADYTNRYRVIRGIRKILGRPVRLASRDRKLDNG